MLFFASLLAAIGGVSVVEVALVAICFRINNEFDGDRVGIGRKMDVEAVVFIAVEIVALMISLIPAFGA